MGVSTLGKIKGFVRPEVITYYIRKNYDSNAISDIKMEKRDAKFLYPPHKTLYGHKFNPSYEKYHYCNFVGRITFSYKGEERSLFYYYTTVNFHEGAKYYEEIGLMEMVESETTYINLGCYGKSEEIITDLVSNLGGGWVDVNDCDDIPYAFIEATPDSAINVEYQIASKEEAEKRLSMMLGYAVVIE